MANTFHLQIVTVDGLAYEGNVQRVTIRSVHGDLAILARHINYCTAVGMGTARVLMRTSTSKEHRPRRPAPRLCFSRAVSRRRDGS